MTQENPHQWLHEHGDYLYRFALARLKDSHQAEDAVQETFLAAIKSDNFAERSTQRTWLTGILKHKIVDLLRKNIRETPASDLMLDQESSMDAFFDEKGRWCEKPATWGIPEESLEQSQFLHTLQHCMTKMPQKLASIFMLRDIDEQDNEEICKAMNITTTNAWVMLYRARMSIRKCLEIHWLQAKR